MLDIRDSMLTVRSRSFPLPSSQDLGVDFLENRPSPFQKHTQNCVFDPDKQQFAPKDQFASFADTVFNDATSADNKVQLENTRTSLQAAIQAFKDQHDQKDKKNAKATTLTISDGSTWSDVIAAVRAAEETYLKDESPTGKIRKAFRKVEEHSRSIQPFLGMLPDGEYKTLCGGLTLILKVEHCYCVPNFTN